MKITNKSIKIIFLFTHPIKWWNRRDASSNSTKWKIGSIGLAENEIKPYLKQTRDEPPPSTVKTERDAVTAAPVDPQQRGSSTTSRVEPRCSSSNSRFWLGNCQGERGSYYRELWLKKKSNIHGERTVNLDRVLLCNLF